MYWNPLKRREWATHIQAIWHKDPQRHS
jgi:hypothetical protein